MIRIIDDLTQEVGSGFGGKASGLGHLARRGVPVPPTLCVSAEGADMSRPDLDGQLHSIIRRWSAALPQARRWIVRSSHACEDSERSTSAGLYPSRVVESDAVNDPAPLVRVLKEILLTLLRDSGNSAVLVQPFIDGTISGVLFSSDPNVGQMGEGVLTFVEGACSELVGGTKEPTTVRFSDEGPPAGLPRPLSERWGELLVYCRRVEGGLGVPVDCEFTIDGSGNLFMLQSRPITSLTGWRFRRLPEPVKAGQSLPPSVEAHPKIQLRLACERSAVAISPAWVVNETAWATVDEFRLPASCYSSVLIHPRLVDGKVKRKFSRDGYSGAATVLAAASGYWVRHALVTEVLAARLTGVATLSQGTTIVEVARGHFVPKGVVPPTVYQVRGGAIHLLERPRQTHFYEIDPESGRAQKRPWRGSVSLDGAQVSELNSIIGRLGLKEGDFLEFGVLAGGQVFVIDIQSGRADENKLTANRQVISLGEAEGALCKVDLSPEGDDTEQHYFEFAASLGRAERAAEPVVIATPLPALGLLAEFQKQALDGKQVVAVIFEIYSPLCHLSVLLREMKIPAVVVPDFRRSELSEARRVRVSATTDGGKVIDSGRRF